MSTDNRTELNDADAVIVIPGECKTWHNTLITGLRILLDDTDANIYSDYDLEDTLVVAASIVNQEVNFNTNYTIGINPPSISPDPIVNNDKAFVNLVSLKAACLLDKASLGYNNIVAGFGARCGSARLATFSRSDGFGALIDNGYCLSYETAKKQFNAGGSRNKKSVLSPFINKDFDPFYYKSR